MWSVWVEQKVVGVEVERGAWEGLRVGLWVWTGAVTGTNKD